MNPKLVFQKEGFLRILLFLFFITIYQLPFTDYRSFAQHEGHQPQAAKKEIKKKAIPGKKTYYCPMHPAFTSDKPGSCAICGMNLVAKEEEPREEAKDKDAIYLNTERQQLIGVKTDKVAFRKLTRTLRTVGQVAFDPELYKAQQEYIEAVNTLEKIKTSPDKDTLKRMESLAGASRLKLQLNGLSGAQIEELAKNKKNDESLLIASGKNIWVYATIYEYEAQGVKPGEPAKVRAVSYPDKEFEGKIIAIDPVFDQETRSVRARIKLEDTQGLLKPNMYVDVEFLSDLGALLSLPREAVMDTGTRKIVFLALPDGYFKPQEIKTGAATEDFVEVKEGLKENDSIVTSGNFLIDSESKLKSALEGTGHQHGQ